MGFIQGEAHLVSSQNIRANLLPLLQSGKYPKTADILGYCILLKAVMYCSSKNSKTSHIL